MKTYRFSRFTQDVLSEKTDYYCQELYLFSYFDNISQLIKHKFNLSNSVFVTTFTHNGIKTDHYHNSDKHRTYYSISVDNNIIYKSTINYDRKCPFKLLIVKTKPFSLTKSHIHFISRIEI